jgi:hypothetical protein
VFLPTHPKCAKNRGLPTLSQGALSPAETRHRWVPPGQSGLSPIFPDFSPSAENLDASVFIPFLARRAQLPRAQARLPELSRELTTQDTRGNILENNPAIARAGCKGVFDSPAGDGGVSGEI